MSTESADPIKTFLNENRQSQVELLLEAANENTHFTWNDTDESLTPKTWGNAIESGVLEPINKRQYELIEQEQLNAYLNGDEELEEFEEDEDEEEIDLPELNLEETKWSKSDKVMAIIGFFGILSFSIETLRNPVYTVMDVPFGIFLDFLPFYAVIFILATLTSLWSTVVREYIHDMSVSDFRKHIRALRDDDSLFGLPDDATREDEERMMEVQNAMMKAQIRPFGWIMAISIPTILWIFTTANVVGVGETLILPIAGEMAWSSGVVGPLQAWIFWYIVCSIAMSQVLKKFLKLID